MKKPKDTEEVILLVAITEPTTVFAKPDPDADVVGRIETGSVIPIIKRQAPYYEVRWKQKKTGWVHEKNLSALNWEIDAYAGIIAPEPLIDYLAIETLHQVLENTPGKELILGLLERGKELELLLVDSFGVLRRDPQAVRRFEATLSFIINRVQPPARPDGFSLKALQEAGSGEQRVQSISNPFPPMPSVPRMGTLPCLIFPPYIGRIVGALIRLALWRGPDPSPVVNDFLWAGLWAIGETLREIEPVELLYGAALDVQSGRSGAAARFATLAESVVKTLSEPVQRQGFGESFPRFKEQPNPQEGTVQFTSAHFTAFPGDPIAPLFTCRAEHWDRTARAVLCCGQTYRIDEVTTDGCYGDLVIIRGEGFRSERSWHIGSGRTELKSDVIFTGTDGERVAPADEDYVSWTDTEVRVHLPDGSVSGPVEMSIICTRNLRGESIASECGLQTRLPAHNLRDTVITVRAATFEHLSLVINGRTTRVRAGETTVVEAEACQPVRVGVRVARAESVAITDSSGSPVEFPEGAPGPQRTVEGVVEVAVPTDETYTVRATSSCGDPPPRMFRINRYLQVTPSVESRMVTAGTEFAGEIRISCTPETIDRDEITVMLRVVGDNPGISPSEVSITVPRSRDRMPFTTSALSIGCGAGSLEATAIDHRPGRVNLRIIPIDVDTTFTGSATMRINDSRFAGPFTLPLNFTMRFSSDRRTIFVTSFPPIATPVFPVPGVPSVCDSTNQVTVILVGGGMGEWDCSSGVMTLPIVLRFSHSLDCGIFGGPGDSIADFTLTTETVTTPGIPGIPPGSRLDSTGSVVLVGAGRFREGFLGGEGIGSPSSAREFSIRISGVFAPVPPPCCV